MIAMWNKVWTAPWIDRHSSAHRLPWHSFQFWSCRERWKH